MDSYGNMAFTELWRSAEMEYGYGGDIWHMAIYWLYDWFLEIPVSHRTTCYILLTPLRGGRVQANWEFLGSQQCVLERGSPATTSQASLGFSPPDPSSRWRRTLIYRIDAWALYWACSNGVMRGRQTVRSPWRSQLHHDRSSPQGIPSVLSTCNRY